METCQVCWGAVDSKLKHKHDEWHQSQYRIFTNLTTAITDLLAIVQEMDNAMETQRSNRLEEAERA